MLHYILLLLTTVTSQCEAADPSLFCKCFCGSNSTIFELPLLDPKPCSNCTKQFCLDNVQDGMCDGIADETCPSNDFRTTCFARDSVKDESIVFLFLILTVGLLISAALKPRFDRWQEGRQNRSNYSAVANQEH